MSQVFLLFIPNYFGDSIKTESEKLLNAVYESTYHQDKKFKKMILVMMERLKNPLTIGSSSRFQLSHERFLDTCQAAYSIYNILLKLLAMEKFNQIYKNNF